MTSTPMNPPVELIAPEIDETAVVRMGSRDPEAPVVLLLHGLGSHERDLTGLVPYLPPSFAYASLRGIYRYVQGYAWLESDIGPAATEKIQTSAAAVETWIAQQTAPVVGAIGFSQGGILGLQLLRRDPHALDWIVQLSGAPFPAAMPGDAALAEVKPPALWGHGGLDPLFDEDREQRVREYMRAHTTLEEERRPHLGHAVDEVELRAIAAFLQRRADERA
ncbi:dienelactone hydrolase family protein [Brachybacterium sp. p3-SID1565]|uniref:Dienelactone hydrolase family protein n=1 Tax=Brachybacterium epidermidis TaxID=2781983 RepID=A0ABR9VYL9_9MICO|nr:MULTISPECIES: dienelactone hydrolase family protein [Brachybacterium]MBE9403272.1 dienelactone hydrolase family protein [Brachybacterium epidermidis]MCT1384669.1 dienelactone hydrolase family protein [Brachybacterium sp. p3-SID1565]